VVQVVADDDLVPIPLERRARLGYQQLWVCFQLEAHGTSQPTGFTIVEDGGQTLKETIKPSRVHSSTIGFRILGTWSISISRLPLPDWILCSD